MSDEFGIGAAAAEGARLLHLLGLAVGLGLALFLDARAVSRLHRPFTRADLTLYRQVHSFIGGALAVLWVSGLMLFLFRTGGDFSAVTPKLVAKLAVVAGLTIAAALISYVVLPALARHLRRAEDALGRADMSLRSCLGAMPPLSLAAVALAGGLSAGSWASAMVLGALTPLRSWSADPLMAMLTVIYSATFIATIVIVGAAVRGVSIRARRRPPIVA